MERFPAVLTQSSEWAESHLEQLCTGTIHHLVQTQKTEEGDDEPCYLPNGLFLEKG